MKFKFDYFIHINSLRLRLPSWCLANKTQLGEWNFFVLRDPFTSAAAAAIYQPSKTQRTEKPLLPLR